MQSEPKAPTQRRPKGRKQQIVRYARRLFLERGYAAVTMAQVAKGVGITAGALYRHFDNKSHLLEEVFRESFGHLGTPPPVSAEPAEVIDRAILMSTEFADVADLWRTELHELPPDFRKRMRDDLVAWVQVFIDMAARARPQLDAGQAAMIGWAMQSILTLPRPALRGIPAGRHSDLQTQLLHSLLAAELEPSGPVQPRGAAASPANGSTSATRPTSGTEPTPRAAMTVHSTRERLLLAAIDLFGRRGFQAVSMDTIGAAADVTGPNLYSHFDGKEALFQAACDRGAHAAWIAVDQAYRDATDAHDALRRVVTAHCRLSQLWIAVRGRRAKGTSSHEQLQRESADYLVEWVHLIVAVQPTMSRAEARVRALSAFTLADDLKRTGPVRQFTAFHDNLVNIIMAVLIAPDNSSQSERGSPATS